MERQTIVDLKRRLTLAGVSYDNDMSHAQLQAIVDTLPPDPAQDLLTKLPTGAEVVEAKKDLVPPLDSNPEPKQAPTPSVIEAEKDSQIATLTQQVKDLAAMVRSVADKGRLNVFDEQRRPEMGKLCHVSVYNDKPVVGWSKMTKNRVVKYQNQPHTYEHTTEVLFLDGSIESLDYTVFHRDRIMVKAIVNNENHSSKTGRTTYTVETKDYGTFDIDTTFIN